MEKTTRTAISMTPPMTSNRCCCSIVPISIEPALAFVDCGFDIPIRVLVVELPLTVDDDSEEVVAMFVGVALVAIVIGMGAGQTFCKKCGTKLQ